MFRQTSRLLGMNRTIAAMTVTLGCFLLSGCADAMADNDEEGLGDSPETSNIGQTSSAYTVTSDEIPLDWHGGTGGTADHQRCDLGEVSVGFVFIHNGYLIHDMGLLCAKLDAR